MARQEGRSAEQLMALPDWIDVGMCTGDRVTSAVIGPVFIHHVASRIPNYHLQRCYDSHPELRQATTLTLAESVRTLRLTLWDEDQRRLIGFRELDASRNRPVSPGAP